MLLPSEAQVARSPRTLVGHSQAARGDSSGSGTELVAIGRAPPVPSGGTADVGAGAEPSPNHPSHTGQCSGSGDLDLVTYVSAWQLEQLTYGMPGWWRAPGRPAKR
jgi:hypothetical protein